MAVTDFEINGLQVYPNPAVNSLKFSLDNLSETSVAVYDTNGRRVLETSIDQNNSIDVSGLNKGVYLIQLEIEGQTVSKQFIKQ